MKSESDKIKIFSLPESLMIFCYLEISKDDQFLGLYFKPTAADKKEVKSRGSTLVEVTLVDGWLK